MTSWRRSHGEDQQGGERERQGRVGGERSRLSVSLTPALVRPRQKALLCPRASSLPLPPPWAGPSPSCAPSGALLSLPLSSDSSDPAGGPSSPKAVPLRLG